MIRLFEKQNNNLIWTGIYIARIDIIETTLYYHSLENSGEFIAAMVNNKNEIITKLRCAKNGVITTCT